MGLYQCVAVERNQAVSHFTWIGGTVTVSDYQNKSECDPVR